MALLNNRASIKGKLQRYDAMTEQIQIRKAEVNQKLIQMKSEEMGQDELLQARQQELEAVRQELNRKRYRAPESGKAD